MDSESNVIHLLPKEIKEAVYHLGLTMRNPTVFQSEVTVDELVKFVSTNPSLANFFGLYIDPETFDIQKEVAREESDIADIIDATDPAIWRKKSD